MKKQRIGISDHAIVRYLQRAQGVDIEALKARILPPASEDTVREFGGNGIFPLPDTDAYIVVIDYTVVTVLRAQDAAKNYTHLRGKRGVKP